jgi:transposase
MRFVTPLTEEQRENLSQAQSSHSNSRCRQRAQAILLSDEGYNLARIHDILKVNQYTVSLWINRFESNGINGLVDLARSGRPTIYEKHEVEIFKNLLDEEPRQIKQAQIKLQELTGKTSCTVTLKRAIKKF